MRKSRAFFQKVISIYMHIFQNETLSFKEIYRNLSKYILFPSICYGSFSARVKGWKIYSLYLALLARKNEYFCPAFAPKIWILYPLYMLPKRPYMRLLEMIRSFSDSDAMVLSTSVSLGRLVFNHPHPGVKRAIFAPCHVMYYCVADLACTIT